MTDTLTIGEGDTLTLDGDDTLEVDNVVNNGTVSGTGTLVVSHLTGEIATTVNLVILPAAPTFSVVKTESGTLQLFIEKQQGGSALPVHTVQISGNSDYSTPTEYNNVPAGFLTIAASATNYVRVKATRSGYSSGWSSKTITTSAAASFRLESEENRVTVYFPAADGGVTIERRILPNGSWNQIASGLTISPFNDDLDIERGFEYVLEYRWKSTGSEWIETKRITVKQNRVETEYPDPLVLLVPSYTIKAMDVAR